MKTEKVGLEVLGLNGAGETLLKQISYHLNEAAVARAFEELFSKAFSQHIQSGLSENLRECTGHVFLNRFNAYSASPTVFLVEYCPSVHEHLGYVQRAIAKGDLLTKTLIFQGAFDREEHLLEKQVVPLIVEFFSRLGWEVKTDSHIFHAA